MDHVEVYNCSQRNTHHSAIRFESSELLWQRVTNSTVHGSIAWSLSAQYSKNIQVDSSVFLGARAVGVGVFESSNFTMNNAIVGDVRHR